jgi:hypothetical protein
MQIYTCNHCGLLYTETLWLFLHIFTNHLHKDIALDQDTARDFLRTCGTILINPTAIGAN